MAVPAIKAEGLSKRYRIGGRESSKSFREALVDLMAEPFRRIRRFGRSSHREEDSIWALKDVCFEVQPGEIVGIIGPNGAGKTTLLKILSRITEPTQGRAVISGRVASLLEVGTGFHGELTGRENIHLSGAILGMSKKEIRKKFDEIVDFSGIERFIDTPVKRYSSGMRVRLGFAVAAHLEPEILLIDEVLAVGDAAFKKKCLGKMGSVAKEGRTVLFVSHNMGAITSLCPRCALLISGTLVRDGASRDVVRDYLLRVDEASSGGYRDLGDVQRVKGDQEVRFTSIRLCRPDGGTSGSFFVGEPIQLDIRFSSAVSGSGQIGYTISTFDGVDLFTSSTSDQGLMLDLTPGEYLISTRIAPNYLRPGKYVVRLGVTCRYVRDLIREAISFEVAEDRHYSKSLFYNLPGHMFFGYEWSRPAKEVD